MEKLINFKINGIEVTAQKGETILTVARKNEIYIPTMCYLSKTTACASCRMCIVEAEGMDGFVLSCNTPPVEGISITTDTQALQHERVNIMKLYDVNHPLECGVCDKSGECDLQNKTLEFGVGEQSFTTKDQHRPIKHWGLIDYEPSLCILCEKCVHVCNEIIGDDAIEVKVGGYKSTIVPKNSELLDCTFCGECIAVCPVGALTSSDFKYSANAWEMSKVPATCAHCSAGCPLEYESRHTGISGDTEIFRVKNNFEFSTLCGAGRFGFDFDSKAKRDEGAFLRAVEAVKNAKAIRFSSIITNEEAHILSLLKSKFGIKLFNEDARVFAEFMRSYSSVSGKLHHSATLDAIKASDAVVVVGSRIATDNPMIRYAITTAARHNGAKVLYAHPMEDTLMQGVVTQMMKYEVGTEEGVMALLAHALTKDADLDENEREFFNNLDFGYLCAETNIGDEEFEQMIHSFKRAKRRVLVVGGDLISHPRAGNIAKLAAIIEKYSDFSLMVVPKAVNTLGASLIVDLDKDEQISDVVGYGAKGDFIISSLAGADMASPAFNQQEGTIISADNRVLPTNAAVGFDGYELNDIANALGIVAVNTIDYTAMLSKDAGFNGMAFDELQNFLSPLGVDERGYLLDEVACAMNGTIDELDDMPEFNGTIIYHANPVLQFNAYTNTATQLPRECELVGSAQFAVAAKVSDGELVEFLCAGEMVQRVFRVDETLKGTVALNPTFDLEREIDGYRFEKSQIKRVVNG